MSAQHEPAPTPKPGSDEALAQGCRCPRLDNAYGRGLGGDGQRNGWAMNGDCPIHGLGGVPEVARTDWCGE